MRQINSLFDPQWLLLHAACFGFISLLIVLAVGFPSRVPEWQHISSSLAMSGCLYAACSIHLARRMSGFSGSIEPAVRVGSVLVLNSFLFSAVSRFQHVFVDEWNDDLIISLEHTILGEESTLIAQRFVSPHLTEWMMCAYVLYILLLPLVAFDCFRSGGNRAVGDYMLNLTLANLLCYAGFILFPVAGPLCHHPEYFSVPLQGGVFTDFGEYVRTRLHYQGGCLPSPHSAATTVMIVMLYRYKRKRLFLLFPLLITIFPATVYGRYHYATDSVAGVLTAACILICSPTFIRWMKARFGGQSMRTTFAT